MSESEKVSRVPSKSDEHRPFTDDVESFNVLSALCATVVRGTSVSVSPSDALRSLLESCQQLAFSKVVLLLLRSAKDLTPKVFLSSNPLLQGKMIETDFPETWDRFFVSDHTLCIQQGGAEKLEEIRGLVVEKLTSSKEELEALGKVIGGPVESGLFSPVSLAHSAFDGGLLCVINKAKGTKKFTYSDFVVARCIAEACGNVSIPSSLQAVTSPH